MFSSTASAGVTVFDDVPAVANLKPQLLAALRRAATDAAADGVEFYVNSGWRTPAHQERLLNEAIIKYGSRQEAARWVATPDRSAHVSGDAVDIGHAAAKAWLAEHGAAYGLCQIYRNEPWHFELRPEAIEHGCPPLYADAAHDPRLFPGSSRAGMAVAIYGCEELDAALLGELAARFGIRPTLVKAPISEANADQAHGARCISIDHKAYVTPAVLLALSKAGVEYISTRSVGYNHIDVEFARSLGIAVQNVSYSPDSVADYTLMLMLMAVRNAKYTIRSVDANDYRLPDRRGKELRDLTVGVVGTGRIGSAVMDRLRAFGCRTVAYDTRPTGQTDPVSLEELLRRSDIVTLHTPLTADTYHLIDRRRIEQLKHGAVLVNTGRGALVDTDGLVHALESGTLAGAALDVIEGEEGIFYTDCGNSVVGNPVLVRLQQMPNVVISPHTAYYTEHAVKDMYVESITNCLRFENGKQHG